MVMMSRGRPFRDDLKTGRRATNFAAFRSIYAVYSFDVESTSMRAPSSAMRWGGIVDAVVFRLSEQFSKVQRLSLSFVAGMTMMVLTWKAVPAPWHSSCSIEAAGASE